MLRSLSSLALLLALALAPGCASNPTPHPAGDSGFSEPTTGDASSAPSGDTAGENSDDGRGQLADVGSRPGPVDGADAAADAAADAPLDGADDGDAAIDGDLGPPPDTDDLGAPGDAGPPDRG